MNPQKQTPQDLSKEQQESTNGGGILGNDGSSMLSTSLGVNLHSSSTDEDGETRSSSLGGDINSDSMFNNND